MPKTIATWNVQRGGQIQGIVRMLAAHQVDVALLQECDVGMARSGNIHVPRKIAHEMQAHYVMAIEFEEEGLGSAEEIAYLEKRYCPDELGNRNGLHCNAVIGRGLPLLSHHVELSAGREWIGSDQPRNGGRKALIAKVDGVYYATVHLECRTTPGKRAGQFARLLKALDKLQAKGVVIGGDMNTKEPGEPLFDLAAAHGYAWRDANVDEGRFAGRRLDWFFHRGVEVCSPLTIDATAISDHDLMLIEVRA